MRLETEANTESFKRLLEQAFPELQVSSMEFLGSGLHSMAFLINSEYVFRHLLAERPDVLQHEAALLAAIHGKIGVQTPILSHINHEHRLTGYRALTGLPLLSRGLLPDKLSQQIASRLSPVVRKIHAFDADRAVARDDNSTLSEWKESVIPKFEEIREALKKDEADRVERFLGTDPPKSSVQHAFCHNDLGIEHVLVDENFAISGIIDWGDAAVTDPAHDYGRLARDLGISSLDVLIGNEQHDVSNQALKVRSLWIAKYTLLEDLHFGLVTGRDLYVDKSLHRFHEFF